MGRIRNHMMCQIAKGSGRWGSMSRRNAVVRVRAVAAENQEVRVAGSFVR